MCFQINMCWFGHIYQLHTNISHDSMHQSHSISKSLLYRAVNISHDSMHQSHSISKSLLYRAVNISHDSMHQSHSISKSLLYRAVNIQSCVDYQICTRLEIITEDCQI